MRRVGITIAVSLLIPLSVALGLIASQRPGDMPGTGGIDFAGVAGLDLSAVPKAEAVLMRDGYLLQVRRYGDAGPLVVLVHGSGWHGMQFHALAPALGARARVLVPDLRGHGAAPGVRGDVAYKGQFEDDLADLIAAERAPGQRVVMVGHSSGGGLVVRMAGGAHGALMDRAVLLAPFLQHDAPMTRPNSGGWAKPLTRRIIGLSMLNTVGVHALDGLVALQLDMPRAVKDGPLGHTVTDAYSWRLNQSFAPRRDWQADVASLPPFTLVAGSADRAFDAALYAPVLRDITDLGTYVTLPGVGHLDLVDAPATLAAIEAVLDGL